MTDKKPILITGSHRSGTTWVGKMISMSSQVFYIQEPFNPNNSLGLKLDNWFQHIDTENENLYQQQIIDLLNLNYDLIKKLKTTRNFKDFRVHTGQYRNCLINKALQTRPLLKDPIAFFSAEWLAKRFKMKVIVMIRHPAAFVGSIKKARAKNWQFNYNNFLRQPSLMDKYLDPFREQIELYARQPPKSRVEHGILLYNIFYSVAQKYRENYNDWMFLRHEDLSIDPCHAFQEVYQRLNLNYSEKIASTIYNYSNQKIEEDSNIDLLQIERNSYSNISSWQHRLSKAEVELVRLRTHKVAKEFYLDSDWNI